MVSGGSSPLTPSPEQQMRRATAPIFRGQGNALFKTDRQNSTYRRGQEVPYGSNGAPPPAIAEPGFLLIDINDLASAVAAEPLFEITVPPGFTIVFNGSNAITAGVAATASTVLPLKKNGAANGDITVTGASGTATFSDSTYAAGDLFSLYPPATPDATLDRLRIALGTN
jgi:hypothetical protein